MDNATLLTNDRQEIATEIREGARVVTLRIESATLADSGVYYCVAENNVRTNRTKITVQVEPETENGT